MYRADAISFVYKDVKPHCCLSHALPSFRFFFSFFFFVWSGAVAVLPLILLCVPAIAHYVCLLNLFICRLFDVLLVLSPRGHPDLTTVPTAKVAGEGESPTGD